MSSEGIDPMAVDTYQFLMRELEFTYLSVRIQFITGLYAFITSLAVRALLTFGESSNDMLRVLLRCTLSSPLVA